MVEQVTLSARGEARRTIAPDYITVQRGLGVTADSKLDALAGVRAAQQRLIGALTDLGGVVLTVESRRNPLTWSMGAVGTHEEQDFDKMTGRHGPTGRVVANGAGVLTARDMGWLTGLAGAVASVDHLHVEQVGWHVDSDNAAWREVRADAIAAALEKGRDYAAALGGTVTRVRRSPTLGCSVPMTPTRAVMHNWSLTAGADALTDTPSFDPVPQEIHAVVEARLVAEVKALGSATSSR